MRRAHLFWNVGLLLLGTLSCKRKEGCMDPTAANYCPDCKKGDNGQCIWNYTVTFWLTDSTASRLQSLGIDTLYVTLSWSGSDMSTQTREVGFMLRSQARPQAPACNDAAFPRYTFSYKLADMPHTCSGGIFGGGSKCWIIQYSASSPTQGEVRSGSFTIGPGVSGCYLIAL